MADLNGAGLYLTCENMECASKVNSELEGVNLWKEAKHDVSRDSGRLFGTCQICQHVRRVIDKQKLRYPMISMSAGEVFQSRNDEKAWAKKVGAEPV